MEDIDRVNQRQITQATNIDNNPLFDQNLELATEGTRFITNDLGDNAKDNDFMICPRCGKIYSVKNELKFKSQIEPFTNLNEDREVRIFTPKSSRRRKIGESFNHKNNEEIPKLVGKEDTDLKALLRDRAGTINYINAENDEGDDDRYY